MVFLQSLNYCDYSYLQYVVCCTYVRTYSLIITKFLTTSRPYYDIFCEYHFFSLKSELSEYKMFDELTR